MVQLLPKREVSLLEFSRDLCVRFNSFGLYSPPNVCVPPSRTTVCVRIFVLSHRKRKRTEPFDLLPDDGNLKNSHHSPGFYVFSLSLSLQFATLFIISFISQLSLHGWRFLVPPRKCQPSSITSGPGEPVPSSRDCAYHNNRTGRDIFGDTDTRFVLLVKRSVFNQPRKRYVTVKRPFCPFSENILPINYHYK